MGRVCFVATLAAFLFAFPVFQVSAQKTAYYLDDEAPYRSGVELFSKQKYGAALEKFDEVVEQRQQVRYDVWENSKYYKAICALELFHRNAEYLLEEFIENHPESPKIKQAYFQMGRFQYRKKNYHKTIDWLEKISTYDLKNEELAEYYFKLGYSYFQQEQWDDARSYFSQVKGVENKYAAPATYYYGHIAYMQDNYQTALQEFIKLQDDPNFSPIVPYYITQLYYLQGKYDKVIEYAPPVLEGASAQRAPEIAKLIGSSLYKQERYAEAIPYLQRFEARSNIVTREDHYQLGYALYKGGEFHKAVEAFQQVVNGNDTLTQTAYYHIADCHLKNGNKKYARDAFRMASKYSYDEQLQEDALFNYAKLSYELSYSPYNEAIEAFEEYIAEHPNSRRTDEAYSFLLSVYLTTKNYSSALESIEKIKKKDQEVKKTYQKIAYFRGIELFNDLNYKSAIYHFDKSLKYPLNKDYEAGAYYWKGEAWYRQQEWDKAIAAYKDFLFIPGVVQHKHYQLVNYNLGYCYFKQDEFREAIEWFRKYTHRNGEDKKKLSDAYIRIGDSYFLLRDNQMAIDFYDKAVKLGKLDTDYAIFQIAVCQGLQGKDESKITTLNSLLSTYENTKYAADAKYEIAETYFFQDNYGQALDWFTKLRNEHPKSSYVKRALLNSGQIHYNKENDLKALELFKKVVTDYPGTKERNEAFEQIRKIYVARNEVAQFEEWLQGEFPNYSKGTLDTTNYEVAEQNYLEGNYMTAYNDFRNYLEKFPNGYFELNARFYKAECAYSLGRYDEALKGYNYVIGRAKNIFTEKSLIRAGEIHISRGNWNEAKLMFSVLEEVAEVQQNLLNARIGLMRSNFELNLFEEAIVYANKLLSMEKVPEEVVHEAHLIIAKSALSQDKIGLALIQFEETAGMSQAQIGAEAQFNVAYIRYLQENYDEAEQEIFDLINNRPSYSYWVAKSFILLADNYVAKGDPFQAKLVLKNLLDKYEGDEQLKSLAQQKLDELIAREKAEQEQQQQQEEMKIQFEEDGKFQELFDEEEMELLQQDTLENGGNDE